MKQLVACLLLDLVLDVTDSACFTQRLSNVGKFDMSLLVPYVIVTHQKRVDVSRRVSTIAEEFALTDVCKLRSEVRACFWSHDSICKAAHGLVTEYVG